MHYYHAYIYRSISNYLEDSMENKPTLLNADQVAQRLGVSKSTAYNIIKELNREMQESGCKVIQGRVCSDKLEEAFFGTRRVVGDDR